MKSPSQITPEAKAFAEQIVSGGGLIFVDSRPEKGQRLLECFETVETQVTKAGGEMILGWCFFDWPSVLLTAELHAVWKKPSGDYLDIAPHQVKQSRILFLPDPKAEVPKIQEMNRFFPIGTDPLIQRCIDLERACHMEGNPDSPYLVMTPKLQRLQMELVATRATLADKFGWPPGTPIAERAAAKMMKNLFR